MDNVSSTGASPWRAEALRECWLQPSCSRYCFCVLLRSCRASCIQHHSGCHCHCKVCWRFAEARACPDIACPWHGVAICCVWGAEPASIQLPCLHGRLLYNARLLAQAWARSATWARRSARPRPCSPSTSACTTTWSPPGASRPPRWAAHDRGGLDVCRTTPNG